MKDHTVHAYIFNGITPTQYSTVNMVVHRVVDVVGLDQSLTRAYCRFLLHPQYIMWEGHTLHSISMQDRNFCKMRHGSGIIKNFAENATQHIIKYYQTNSTAETSLYLCASLHGGVQKVKQGNVNSAVVFFPLRHGNLTLTIMIKLMIELFIGGVNMILCFTRQTQMWMEYMTYEHDNMSLLLWISCSTSVPHNGQIIMYTIKQHTKIPWDTPGKRKGTHSQWPFQFGHALLKVKVHIVMTINWVSSFQFLGEPLCVDVWYYPQ